jgi:hypothetical protein
MMLQHLSDHYGVDGDNVTVCRTRPDDFIIRFSRREDLDRALGSPEPQGAPFSRREDLDSCFTLRAFDPAS